MYNAIIESLVLELDQIGRQHPDFLYSYLTIQSTTCDKVVFSAEIHIPRGIDFRKVKAASNDWEEVKRRLEAGIKQECSVLEVKEAA